MLFQENFTCDFIPRNENTAMAQQLSTSISDGVLALSAFHACWRLLGSSLCGVIGFFLVGSAAACGTYRFAQKSPSKDSIEVHKYLAWFATVVGMSYLAAAYYRHEDVSVFANVHVALAFALVLLKRYLTEKACGLASEGTSGFALVSVLVFSVFQFNPYGIIGAALYIISGLVVKTEGVLYGIPRVDIFHYLLAVANISLMLGLSRVATPVYYRPSVMGA